jgi:8-oxo-dGTP diphosphatase
MSGQPQGRKHTEVAVGVLIRPADGALLLSTRPEGKA